MYISSAAVGEAGRNPPQLSQQGGLHANTALQGENLSSLCVKRPSGPSRCLPIKRCNPPSYYTTLGRPAETRSRRVLRSLKLASSHCPVGMLLVDSSRPSSSSSGSAALEMSIFRDLHTCCLRCSDRSKSLMHVFGGIRGSTFLLSAA